MATYFALASSVSISAATTWGTTTTTGATAWATVNVAGNILVLNGKTGIILDADVTVAQIVSTAYGGGTAGGGIVFSGTTSRSVTASLSCGTSTGQAPVIACSHTAGTLTVTGNVLGGGNLLYNPQGISNSSTGSVTVVGNVTGGTGAPSHGIINTGTGTITVTGTVTGGSAAGTFGISCSAIGILKVNNVVGGSNASAYAINSSVATAIIITGTVSPGSATYSIGAATAFIYLNGQISAPLGYVTTSQTNIWGFTGGPFTWFAQGSGGSIASTAWKNFPDGSGSYTLTWASLDLHDVLCANGKTGIILDSDFTCSRISSGEGSPGGGFVFSGTTSRIITASVQGGSTTCIVATHTSNALLSILGNITGGTSSSAYGVSNGGSTGKLYTNGWVTGGTGATAHGIYSSSTGTITVDSAGKYVKANMSATNVGSCGIYSASSATLNITAAVAGGGANSNAHAIHNNSTGPVNITGDVTGGSYTGTYGLYLYGVCTVTIVGNVNGGPSTSCVGVYLPSSAGASSVTITGNVTGSASNTAHGLQNISTTSTITITGTVTAGAASGVAGVANSVTGGTINIIGSLVNTLQSIAIIGRIYYSPTSANSVQLLKLGGGTIYMRNSPVRLIGKGGLIT